jgi:hypothetical protein
MDAGGRVAAVSHSSTSKNVLPALFAKIAHQLCDKKRDVVIEIYSPSKPVATINLNAQAMEQYRENILGGTRNMLSDFLKASGNSKAMDMKVTFKRPTLN